MPPVTNLDRVFHEPNRLAILSALCASDEPVAFTVLRDTCDLTDGNLNRHLKALEDDGIVAIRKAFVDRKPRTTITLTSRGLTRFQAYIDTLGATLKQVRRHLPDPAPSRAKPQTA